MSGFNNIGHSVSFKRIREFIIRLTANLLVPHRPHRPSLIGCDHGRHPEASTDDEYIVTGGDVFSELPGTLVFVRRISDDASQKSCVGTRDLDTIGESVCTIFFWQPVPDVL